MAAANLVVRLLLENDGFDKNIKTAKASIEGFERIGKNVTAVIGKFAVGIGAATTAFGALKEVMNTTKETSIKLASNIEVATSTYNNFMQAIATGDFSFAYQEWDKLIDKARDYKTALLEAQYAHMNYQIAISDLDVDIKEAIQKSKDVRLSDEERSEWGKIANDRVKEAMLITSGFNKIMEDAIGQSVTKEIPWQNYMDPEVFIEANKFMLTASTASKEAMSLRYDIFNKIAQSATNKAAAEYVNAIEAEQRKKVGNPNYKFTPEDRERLKKPFLEKNQKKVNELIPYYQDAIAYKAITLMDEEELKGLQELLGTWQAVNNAITSYNEQLNEVNSKEIERNKITTSSTATATQTNITQQPVYKSIQWFDEEIARLTEEASTIDLSLDKAKYDKIMAQIKALRLEKEAALKVGTVEIPDLSDQSGFEDMEFSTTQINKATEATLTYADALTILSNTLTSMNGVVSDNASAWLNWVANLIQSVNQAVISIMALVPAEQLHLNTAKASAKASTEKALAQQFNSTATFGVASANIAEAESLLVLDAVKKQVGETDNKNSEQGQKNNEKTIQSLEDVISQIGVYVNAKTAEAGATAGAETAKLGPWGWIAIAGVIASVMAAFSALPKFAHGGVINSPFGSGDRVLARVNGGEMILNKHQQTNLFNLLDNGVASSGNGGVKFRIEGKDLVGVLDNYNNRMNKLR